MTSFCSSFSPPYILLLRCFFQIFVLVDVCRCLFVLSARKRRRARLQGLRHSFPGQSSISSHPPPPTALSPIGLNSAFNPRLLDRKEVTPPPQRDRHYTRRRDAFDFLFHCFFFSPSHLTFCSPFRSPHGLPPSVSRPFSRLPI